MCGLRAGLTSNPGRAEPVIKIAEGTIQGHFYSEFGHEAELVDAGIMDPESKVIKDPRRVLNSDETRPRRRLEDEAKEARAAKEKNWKRSASPCRKKSRQRKRQRWRRQLLRSARLRACTCGVVPCPWGQAGSGV